MEESKLQLNRQLRQKYKCKHGRQCKSRCKDCLGHSVYKNKCSRCKNMYIPTNNGLHTCTDCRYYSNCPHGVRLKQNCKECQKIITKNNRQSCEHKKRKDSCNICTKIPKCKHDKKRKSLCIECKPEKACKTCLCVFVRTNSKYQPYCFRCYCVANPDAKRALFTRLFQN